jgi:hypothetical protein
MSTAEVIIVVLHSKRVGDPLPPGPFTNWMPSIPVTPLTAELSFESLVVDTLLANERPGPSRTHDRDSDL